MTWLSDFVEQNEVSRYPVALRTRGGIGFEVGRETRSFFVGHPVHYFENREWKPITLEYKAGRFIGSPFAWIDGAIYHDDKPVAKPEKVLLDGKVYQLDFLHDGGQQFIADTPFGQYIVRFTERGVKTEFVLFENLEDPVGRIIFQGKKYPHGLFETHGRPQLQPGQFDLLRLDPGTDYSADTGDGYVRGSNAVWATARSTSSDYASGQQYLSIGAFLLTGTYYCDRPYLKFDTSGIPDTDVISQVNLKMVMYTDASATDFDVDIVKADWSAYDPVAAGNRESVFDLGLSASLDDNIWRNTSGISTSTMYSSGNLSTAWPSKTGNTYYMLISSPDRDNTTPTDLSYGYMAAQEHVTSGYRPLLAVTHAAVSGNPWYAYAQQ